MDQARACSKCGSVYKVSHTGGDNKNQTLIICEVCGEELRCAGDVNLWRFSLIERRENHLSKT